MRQVFETEYVFHDSRMEGVTVDREFAADAIERKSLLEIIDECLENSSSIFPDIESVRSSISSLLGEKASELEEDEIKNKIEAILKVI